MKYYVVVFGLLIAPSVFALTPLQDALKLVRDGGYKCTPPRSLSTPKNDSSQKKPPLDSRCVETEESISVCCINLKNGNINYTTLNYTKIEYKRGLTSGNSPLLDRDYYKQQLGICSGVPIDINSACDSSSYPITHSHSLQSPKRVAEICVANNVRCCKLSGNPSTYHYSILPCADYKVGSISVAEDASSRSLCQK